MLLALLFSFFLVSADGVVLADSVASNDDYKYLRQYPTGALNENVTGYFSFTYGDDGLDSESGGSDEEYRPTHDELIQDAEEEKEAVAEGSASGVALSL